MNKQIEYCTVSEVAEVVNLPVETVEEMAKKGWFHGKEIDGEYRIQKGDSEFRCSMIHHARSYFGFSKTEITGMTKYIENTEIGVMGGGKISERYQPFEQELAKAGPCWICVALGEHQENNPIHFTVHGKFDPANLGFMVVRADSVCMYEGEGTLHNCLGDNYVRGIIPQGLPGGTYRIHFGGAGSYKFRVGSLAKEHAIRLFLRYFRGTRCGEATEYHPACHQDDGIRDDTGEFTPLAGGWHDAGDFCHITSTTTASYYLAAALAGADADSPALEALVAEAMHGADYNIRARDDETGKVFENKGVGRGMSKDGNFGDNQRMTDNILGSGDERNIRTNGAIQTAMDNLAALGAMCRSECAKSGFVEKCKLAAEKSWTYYQSIPDVRLFHKAKRLYAATEWYNTTGDDNWKNRVAATLQEICSAVDEDGDFRDLDGSVFLGSHYQHGSPLLALSLAASSNHPDAEKARQHAIRVADRLVDLSKLHPYGVTCYAVTRNEDLNRFTIGDGINRWHPLDKSKSYRLYQPFTSYFWQGSSSQLTVLGIGLAILGHLLKRDDYLALASRHWDWCMGMNPYQCCLTHGWGECEAAALSTMVGYMPGGTIQGPIGDQNDVPYFQVGKGMRVGEEPLFNFAGPSYSREYWSPLSGALLWLRMLLK